MGTNIWFYKVLWCKNFLEVEKGTWYDYKLLNRI